MYTLRVWTPISLHISVFQKNTGSFRVISGPWHKLFHTVFKLGTGSQRFTVVVFKDFRLFSTFFITLTRPSATFEVSSTPVAKLTRDSVSCTKGSLNKPDKGKIVNKLPDVFLIARQSLRCGLLVLLRGHFLSEPHIFFTAMRLFGE